MKRLLAYLFLVLGLGLVFSVNANSKDTLIKIGTGGPNGVYFQVGNSICKMVAKLQSKEHGRKSGSENTYFCSAPSTGGSNFNIGEIKKGDLDFGVSQSDWQFHAYNGSSKWSKHGPVKNLRSVFSFHNEPFQIWVRKKAKVKNFRDLKGKIVNIGNPGSGQRQFMEELMSAYGVNKSFFKRATELTSSEVVKALCDGKIDAFVYAVGFPSMAMEQAATCRAKATPISIDTDIINNLVRNNTFYAKAIIPKYTYTGQKEDVITYGVKATVVTSADVANETVYDVVKSVFQNLDEFKRQHPAFQYLNRNLMLEGLSAPLHAGAIKYYNEVGISYPNRLYIAEKQQTKKTQIAKKEPAKTQQAEDDFIKWTITYKDKKFGLYHVKDSEKQKIGFAILDGHKLCLNVIGSSNDKDCVLAKVVEHRVSGVTSYDLNIPSQFAKLFGFYPTKKKEPSQRQEKVLLEFCKVSSLSRPYKYSYPVFKNQSCYNQDPLGALKAKENQVSKVSYQEFLNQPSIQVRKKLNLKTSICINSKADKVWKQDNSCYKKLGQIEVFNENDSFYYIPNNQTQIAKKEPTQTQEVVKKSVKEKLEEYDKKMEALDKKKIAKTTQEEFKPEDKDIDNDAPVIEIAEAITVDSQAYTLKGKVKDKSQIYLTIDGRQVEVKKGKFKVDRFNIDPDEVEEIKIVAIDKWNNKSEKTIKVTIDLKSTELARIFEDLKPNSVRVKTDKNKIAIIIGIEKYANLINLDAKYANRDAKAFRAYATQALGVKASNIKILVDDKATRSQTIKAFKLWLPRIAGDGGKDILIFFAGHGLASDNGEDLYILPQDGESSLLEDTAISRVELISLIQKVNPKSVTMFFDTCYSGQTRDERMLVASLRPIRIVADEQDTPNNFTIFTASNYDQTSGSIEEAKHGMFSYYLMKGLEGKADQNKDKKITNGELIAYLKTNVSKEAFTQNREQDPMLSGDPDQVLMSYR